MSVFSCAAFAQTSTEMAGKILATGPLACTHDATALLIRQYMKMTPTLLLNGLRNQSGLGADWAEGNERYDKVYAIVSPLVAEEEAKNVPLANAAIDKAMYEAFAKRSVSDLKRMFAFLNSPAGKLYWNNMVEGAHCLGTLNQMVRPPMPPLTGDAKDRWEQLEAGLKDGSKRFSERFDALPSSEQENFETGSALVDDIFTNAPAKGVKIFLTEMNARIGVAIAPKANEIRAILKGN